jgi:putative ABC transport system permease protein
VVAIFRSSGEDNGMAQGRTAYAGFFRTMGIPVLRGREFTEADRQDAPRVAVISQLMAQRYWPGEDPIGARFTPWPDTFTVVGVVGDVRHSSLRAEALPTFYLAGAQLGTPSALSLVVRTAREPEPLLSPIRDAIRRVHPRAPITRLEPVRSLVSESAQDDRFRAVLFTVFSLVGTLLAAGGVFGVTARGVEGRRGEIGVRMALGAEDRHLMRIALLPGLVAGLIGLLLGLASALGASRLLASFLFGVETWDPATYGVVALTVLGISLAATYLPSRRIQRLDPATVLREE